MIGKKPSPRPNASRPSAQWHTYDEWIAMGRHVMKGQKSLRRDPKGQPVFAFEQTDATEARPLQRGAKPDHFDDCREPHGFTDFGNEDQDPFQDSWLFT